MVTNIYFISGFALLVVVMLLIDLGLFNKKAHKISNKEAAIWSCVWIGLAAIFGGLVYTFLGIEKASEFYTAFLIEKALSVDNLFVFILVFGFFKVPEQYHHKVLFWGIVGAIVLRAIFIFTGATIISYTYLPDFTILGYTFHEVNIILTLFGLFLVYAGIKSLGGDDDDEQDFSKSFGVKIIKSIFPVTDKFDGGKFFTIENGKKVGTLLLVVVGVIEVTDLIFAVDSIPAIFTVSRDPFILYTSNIFAILGLRTLYFLLANFMHYFAYLKYGLAGILSFIGFKMVIAPIYHISSPLSLSVVATLLFAATIASIVWKPKVEEKEEEKELVA
ncbi:TerC/Alx family metal homeostasis membrane protein [Pontibacter kalidii]|uniref:TerC/Alx family metal homeostasis membrane protein n=1 Tax=Pontibacter kalidii TaxID=2592049 RepID=UPI002258C760|nr:TerC/Alx family metal homeostasis membrane protein [Pontibacter kalidii]